MKTTTIAMLVVAAGVAGAGPLVTLPQIPTPNVPAGTDVRGLPFLPPGEFPVSVQASKADLASAAQIPNFAGLPMSCVLDGARQNYVRVVGRPLGSPMSGATNEGDWDININLNPALLDSSNPRSAFAFPNTNWDPIKGERLDFPPATAGEPAYGWAATAGAGVLMAQVAQNQVNSGCTDGGTGASFPVYCLGHAAPNDFRGGGGYNMLTGNLQGGNGAIFSSFNAIGVPEEYVVDMAYAWFSYHAGWVAGTIVSGNPVQWNTSSSGVDPVTMTTRPFASRGPSLPDNASEVVTLAGNGRAQGRVQFAAAPRGIDAGPVGNDLNRITPATSMLFVTSSGASNDDRFTTLLEDGLGWNYVTRKDNYFPTSGFTEFATEAQNDQVILALPYDTENLQGGKVNADGTFARATDDNTTVITRTGTGRYRLTIPGAAGAEDGMLLLISLKRASGNEAIADRNFFTYEFVNGGYNIESNILDEDFAGSNPFGEGYFGVDSPFYVAYISFANPPVGPAVDTNPGCNIADFAEAFGTLDINDILAFATAFGAGDLSADLFPAAGDGALDINDILEFATAFGAGCP